jgi:signal transduction histidine kinase
MPKILVVDDEENRALFRSSLEDASTSVIETDSGEAALDLIAHEDPDLVLLDVMMPGIDGYEIARRIKEAAGDSFLPVILVTARSDRRERVRGLQHGADDLLFKPIDTDELTLRVRNLLALRSKELTLRSRDLDVLELMHFREEMSALLIHDLKSPTAIVELSLDYMHRELTDLDPGTAEALADARGATRRIGRIVHNMLDLVRLESQRLVLQRAATRPAALLATVAEGRAALTRKRTVTVDLALDDRLEVQADVDLLTRVIENVVDNSLRHVPDGGHLLLSAEARGSAVTLLIGNDGPPVPAELRQSIFEKWSRGGQAGTGNLGLGLYFCRLAMEAHGGRIWVRDEPMPTVFGLELPLVGPGRAPLSRASIG